MGLGPRRSSDLSSSWTSSAFAFAFAFALGGEEDECSPSTRKSITTRSVWEEIDVGEKNRESQCSPMERANPIGRSSLPLEPHCKIYGRPIINRKASRRSQRLKQPTRKKTP